MHFWSSCSSTDDNGFGALRARWPFPPQRPYPPFHAPLTLAHGRGKDGRELVVDLVRGIREPLILELGVFLGGSLARWLEDIPNVRVVGVDPYDWGSNSTDYIDAWTLQKPWKRQWRQYVPQLAEPKAFLNTVYSNLWADQEQTVIVQGFSPSILVELHKQGLRPDVIYFDNDKSLHDLWVAHTLWPTGVHFSGDDWGWSQIINIRPRDAKRGRPYNTSHNAAGNVCDFARKANFRVSARGATWVLHSKMQQGAREQQHAQIPDEVDCTQSEKAIRGRSIQWRRKRWT